MSSRDTPPSSLSEPIPSLLDALADGINRCDQTKEVLLHLGYCCIGYKLSLRMMACLLENEESDSGRCIVFECITQGEMREAYLRPGMVDGLLLLMQKPDSYHVHELQMLENYPAQRKANAICVHAQVLWIYWWSTDTDLP